MKADTVLNRQIGERIKMVRKMKGLTQQQLADTMDITVKHLSSVECGKARFSYEYLIDLCRALDTSTDFLILGKTPAGGETPLPEFIIDTLEGNDEAEKKALQKYLYMYEEIHRH